MVLTPRQLREVHEKDRIPCTRGGCDHDAEEASAQGVYLDFGNHPLAPAIATTTDLGPGIGNGTGIAANGTGIAGTADTIGQGNFELLTGARMAGRCKTASANHTEATKGIIISGCGRVRPGPGALKTLRANRRALFSLLSPTHIS